MYKCLPVNDKDTYFISPITRTKPLIPTTFSKAPLIQLQSGGVTHFLPVHASYVVSVFYSAEVVEYK